MNNENINYGCVFIGIIKKLNNRSLTLINMVYEWFICFIFFIAFFTLMLWFSILLITYPIIMFYIINFKLITLIITTL